MTDRSVRIDPALPDPSEPGMETVLEGLRRATGAARCEVTLSVVGTDATATYAAGSAELGTPLVFTLNLGPTVTGRCAVYRRTRVSQRDRRQLEALIPLIETAITAMVERWGTSPQLELLRQVLAHSLTAMLLLDDGGRLLLRNEAASRLVGGYPVARSARRTTGDGHGLLASLKALVAALPPDLSEAASFPLRRPGQPALEARVIPVAATRGERLLLVTLRTFTVPCGDDLRRALSHYRVSRRESEVLSLLLGGLGCAGIAHEMGISEHTVKDHLKHVHTKLGVHSRTQLMARLALEGLTTS